MKYTLIALLISFPVLSFAQDRCPADVLKIDPLLQTHSYACWYGTEGVDRLEVLNNRIVINGTDKGDYQAHAINIFFGLEGQDQIIGGSKMDIIDGGNDNDSIFARGGDDRISAGTGNDVVYADDGNDDIILSVINIDDVDYGNDIIFTGLGENRIFGLQGNSLVSCGPGNDTIFIKDGYSEIYTGEGLDKIFVYNSPESLNRKQLISIVSLDHFEIGHGEVTDPGNIKVIFTSAKSPADL